MLNNDNTQRKPDSLDSVAKFLEILFKSSHLFWCCCMGLLSLLATCSFRTGVNKGIHLMPEAIRKGIAFYISSVKAAGAEPINREPIEPT